MSSSLPLPEELEFASSRWNLAGWQTGPVCCRQRQFFMRPSGSKTTNCGSSGAPLAKKGDTVNVTPHFVVSSLVELLRWREKWKLTWCDPTAVSSLTSLDLAVLTATSFSLTITLTQTQISQQYQENCNLMWCFTDTHGPLILLKLLYFMTKYLQTNDLPISRPIQYVVSTALHLLNTSMLALLLEEY